MPTIGELFSIGPRGINKDQLIGATVNPAISNERKLKKKLKQHKVAISGLGRSD